MTRRYGSAFSLRLCPHRYLWTSMHFLTKRRIRWQSALQVCLRIPITSRLPACMTPSCWATSIQLLLRGWKCLEEEKMAVILQEVVGAQHGTRFYPDFSGVVRSHNFYPTAPMSSSDGIAAVALGMGRAVVEGGRCLSFCPRYPRHPIQFSEVKDILNNSQSEFWAMDLDHAQGEGVASGLREVRFGLDVAETDGTLAPVASTYNRDNDAVYDGIGRAGARVVSFAPILKQEIFPLAAILDQL